jgi:serine/threonine protein kinase
MCSVLDELNDFFSEVSLEKNTKVINGKYGNVSVLKHNPTQKLFFKKEIKLKYYEEIEPMVHGLMKNNRYFIKLYYSVTTLKYHVLIMDFIKGGDLFDLLKKEKSLSYSECKLIILQLIEALNALHKFRIIHNDIKLENILYTRYKQIYLADYGLCKIVGQKSYQDGTIDYFSPEKILYYQYDFHFDWWSVGVLLYELITGTHPFKMDQNEELNTDKLLKRQQKKIKFHNTDPKIEDFITKILKYNLNYRLINHCDIIKHEFLQ